MITLNMIEASVAQMEKNAALLSSCHTQNSRSGAVFCGIWNAGLLRHSSAPSIVLDLVLDLFRRRAIFAA
jgi:hypothetical protein